MAGGDEFWLACCMCHSDATLLCRLGRISPPARGVPRLPQNCSSASKLFPHFQHGNSLLAADSGANFAGEAAAGFSFTRAARFGFSFSMAASIVDRSAAMDFFK